MTYFLPPPLLVGSRNSLLYVSTSFIGAQIPSVRPENSPYHRKCRVLALDPDEFLDVRHTQGAL